MYIIYIDIAFVYICTCIALLYRYKLAFVLDAVEKGRKGRQGERARNKEGG